MSVNHHKNPHAARERMYNRLTQPDLIPGFPREVVAFTVTSLLSHINGDRGYSARLREKLKEVHELLANGASAYTETFSGAATRVQNRPYGEQVNALAELLSPSPVPRLHFPEPHSDGHSE